MKTLHKILIGVGATGIVGTLVLVLFKRKAAAATLQLPQSQTPYSTPLLNPSGSSPQVLTAPGLPPLVPLQSVSPAKQQDVYSDISKGVQDTGKVINTGKDVVAVADKVLPKAPWMRGSSSATGGAKYVNTAQMAVDGAKSTQALLTSFGPQGGATDAERAASATQASQDLLKSFMNPFRN